MSGNPLSVKPVTVSLSGPATSGAGTAFTSQPTELSLNEPAARSTLDVVSAGRRHRARRRRLATLAIAVMVFGLFALSLMVGERFYPPSQVIAVILGEQVPGAGFTVGELRLPRACLAILAGAALGIAGVTFQIMLHNALASPDIIGISAGASAAAVLSIVVLHLDSRLTSLFAVFSALATAALIASLSWRDGIAGTRLILIGIGVAAMLDAMVGYLILKAATWDLQTAMRWLTGSVNGATWEGTVPLLLAVTVLAPVLLWQLHNLQQLQLGDDAARALGVPVQRARLVTILAAVGLVAFATAAAGPIAFVAFLAGPIAARVVGRSGSLLIPSALIGAALVLGADFLGQNAFGSRYPVGVITCALGAPYLVYLLIRTNRMGGSL